MIKNYLIIAFRNLVRHKVYAGISVLGLAVGMACCILIMLFIRHEMSYDGQHKDVDQTYRVLRETRQADGSAKINTTGTSGALAAALKENFSEVRQAVRRFDHWVNIRYQDQIDHRLFYIVDPEFLDIFNFPLVEGDARTALRAPSGILISQQMAKRFFKEDDPIGKTITIKANGMEGDYQIAGVLKNMPSNSSMRFHFLTIHMPQRFYRHQWENWLPGSWRMTETFVVLPKGADYKALEKKASELIVRHMGDEVGARNKYYFQPLPRMHLYGGVDYGMRHERDIQYIYQLAAIAFLVLCIACINYMNIATASANNRTREIGMRKVVGAQRHQLIGQFLGETVLLAFISLGMAVCLAYLVLPNFNTLMGRRLVLGVDMLPELMGLSLFVGILAGSYPAFVLSAFRPVEVLKGTQKLGSTGIWLRKGLVGFQFVISIVLMICTSAVYEQLNFMGRKNLGFDQAELVRLGVYSQNSMLKRNPESVKETFSQHAGILRASNIFAWGIQEPKTQTVRPGGLPENERPMYFLGGDTDMLAVYGLELVAGRNFRARTGEFLLNETAVKQLGWSDPIGREFAWVEGGNRGPVVGVVKDFHFQSLHEKIQPILIGNATALQLVLKIHPENVSETMQFLKEKWHEKVPDAPFMFRFLDQEIDRGYRAEQRVGQLSLIFSSLAIFVACLGLFGLAAYTAEQRTKEIGVRKVLGASVGQLAVLLSGDFLRLVVLANVIAWPLAYWAMSRWLQDFAYRIDLGMGVFILGGLLALFVAVVTVGYQTLKAARTNPVESLRYE